MKRDKLLAIPAVFYEAGEEDASNRFTVYVCTNYYDFRLERVGDGTMRLVECKERVVTSVLAANDDLFMRPSPDDEGTIGHVIVPAELDMDDVDGVVRVMAADYLFNNATEFDEWLATYKSVRFGEVHDLSNPF